MAMKPTKGNQMNDMQVRTYQTDGSAALKPTEPRGLYFVPAMQEPTEEGLPARGPRCGRATASRHGMLVVVSSLLVVACVLGALASDLAARRSCAQAIDSAARQEVVVEGGDTVWGIAERSAGERYPVRLVADAIERENGLCGAAVVAGQVLSVPVLA